MTAAEAKALSTDVSDKVIVVFKNQLPGTSDLPRDEARRASAVGQAQSGVVAELARTRTRQVKRFQLVAITVAATVSPGEARRLSANPSVAEVVPDEPIPCQLGAEPGPQGLDGIAPLAGACSPSGQVQLIPQAIEAIHAATQSGKGRVSPRPSATPVPE